MKTAVIATVLVDRGSGVLYCSFLWMN